VLLPPIHVHSFVPLPPDGVLCADAIVPKQVPAITASAQAMRKGEVAWRGAAKSDVPARRTRLVFQAKAEVSATTL
jgi:hypothetical protein